MSIKVENNPKIDGSGIIDCIPQAGKCPRECPECFYNNAFFRTLTEPLIPPLKETGSRIVRMNSGHDSALDKEKVLKQAKLYKNVFFNTAGKDLEFPGPVMLTVNPASYQDTKFISIKDIPVNLMAVRFRANLWNLEIAEEVCEYYTKEKGIPVIFTWMRYFEEEAILSHFKKSYVYRRSILNSYYALPKYLEDDLTKEFQTRYPKVYLCGNRWSSLCKNCGNCLREYYSTKERITT